VAKENYWKWDRPGPPQRVGGPVQWLAWLATSPNRTLELDTVQGLYVVSTIFLGIDQNDSGRGEPLLWETAVVEVASGEVWRPHTRLASGRAMAREIHQRKVRLITQVAAEETLRAVGTDGHVLP